MIKVRPNELDPEQEENLKIKIILSSTFLRKKLEALILLGSSDICDLFNLSFEELEYYKASYFDVDKLISLGPTYVLAYLEHESDIEGILYYIKGETYTKSRLGLKTKFSDSEITELSHLILHKSISECLDDGFDTKQANTRLKCVDTIRKVTNNSGGGKEEESVIDRLSKLVQETGEI